MARRGPVVAGRGAVPRDAAAGSALTPQGFSLSLIQYSCQPADQHLQAGAARGASTELAASNGPFNAEPTYIAPDNTLSVWRSSM